MKKQRAILFDMYGTLLYEEDGFEVLYHHLSDYLGIDRAHLAECREKSSPEAMRGEITAHQRAVLLMRELGLPEDEERIAAFVDKEWNFRKSRIRFYEATIPTLQLLREQGYKLGLVSDAVYPWPEIVAETPLPKLLDMLTFSCEVGATKPEPVMYLSTCEKLGVDPSDCVYAGDGGSDEMNGARNVGIVPVLVDQPWAFCRLAAPGIVSGYQYVIPNIGELPALLEKIDHANESGRDFPKNARR